METKKEKKIDWEETKKQGHVVYHEFEYPVSEKRTNIAQNNRQSIQEEITNQNIERRILSLPRCIIASILTSAFIYFVAAFAFILRGEYNGRLNLLFIGLGITEGISLFVSIICWLIARKLFYGTYGSKDPVIMMYVSVVGFLFFMDMMWVGLLPSKRIFLIISPILAVVVLIVTPIYIAISEHISSSIRR